MESGELAFAAQHDGCFPKSAASHDHHGPWCRALFSGIAERLVSESGCKLNGW
jgi:hypothetical protein